MWGSDLAAVDEESGGGRSSSGTGSPSGRGGGNSDGEVLPRGWEKRVTPTGRTYYKNHNLR